jgi:hypothetical protein
MTVPLLNEEVQEDWSSVILYLCSHFNNEFMMHISINMKLNYNSLNFIQDNSFVSLLPSFHSSNAVLDLLIIFQNIIPHS